MATLKVLSGRQVIDILNGFGFEQVSQKGSHVKLRRISSGVKQILTVPLHRELDRGTLRAIHRQASRFIDVGELEPHFFV